jgi:hypothetical protein
MTGRTKFIVVLVIAAGAGFLLFRASEREGGEPLKTTVARRYRASPVKVGDIHIFRLQLSLPPGPGSEVEVPETVWEKVQDGDAYERRLRSLQVLGIQGLHYRITRGSEVVAEWDEGYPFFWGVIGAAGLGVGVILTAVVALLLGFFGVKKAPNV